MRKPKSISPETRRAILDAAWALISESGRTDVAMAEIATRAGVSRQAIHYAFGDRAGLLLAMVRHKDGLTDHVARLRGLLDQQHPTPETLMAFAGIWLDYLPIIYPVGILLDAASVTDPGAASAWNDRMIAALRGGFERLATSIHARHPLPGEPGQIAQAIWAQVHPTMFRRLVSECGWTVEAFNAHQLNMVRGLLGQPQSPALSVIRE